jgi:hypothetical protein
VIVGLGGLAVADRRAVANRLREVQAWGFPITGYRDWLLADEPAFDVELSREVDVEVIASSMRAIDGAIKIERLGGRRFRVITRRIALPSPKRNEPAIFVGDRRLLQELHERILAPLHSDVGITSVRMGERAKLVLQLPAPQEERAVVGIEGMGAFRDAALIAPPALQALVHIGTDRELPHEARRLDHRTQRVVFATGATPQGVGTIMLISMAGTFSGLGWFLLPGAAIGLIAGVGIGITTVINTNRRNANRVAAVYHQPFPIEGYDDWLLSGRPLLDIALEKPGDRVWLREQLATLTAFSVGANATIPWVEEILWLDDQLVRIETRPTLIEPSGSRIAPFYGGSHTMFGELVSRVLVQLHGRAGIAAVRMGGYIDRRI